MDNDKRRYTASEAAEMLINMGISKASKRIVNYYAFEKNMFDVLPGKRSFSDREMDKLQGIFLLKEKTDMSLDEIKKLINSKTLLEIQEEFGKKPPAIKSFRSDVNEVRGIVVVSNHIVVKMDEMNVLLNTGAPASISKTGEIEVLGQKRRVNISYPGFDFEYLRREIGTVVDAMMGGDILRHLCFVINWAQREIKFSQSPVNINGIAAPLSFISNIPVMAALINGRLSQMYVVTAANHSYLTPELLEGYVSDGEINDFYPGLGRYTVPVYRVPFQLNNQEDICLMRFAGLPEQLLFLLRATNMSGILGTEIFDHYEEIHFNLSHEFLVFRKGAAR